MEQTRNTKYFGSFATFGTMAIACLTVFLVASQTSSLALGLATVITSTIVGTWVWLRCFSPSLPNQKREMARQWSSTNCLPFGFVVYDAQLRIRFANQYALTLYQKNLEQVRGKRDAELLDDSAREMFEGELFKCLSQGHSNSISRPVQLGGDRKMFLMTFSPVAGTDGQPDEVISVWFDVSRVDELGAQLARLNRTLSTLTDSNRVLSSAASETELLARFCENLCTRGGYRIAWMARRDLSGEIIPVVSSGCQADDLAPLSLRWDQAETHPPPISVALRDGISASSHGHHQASGTDERSRFHQRFRIHSCAGFPVKVDGQSRLGICVCSESNDAFDDEEMTLLGDLARDLEFGIAAVRTRRRLLLQEQVHKSMLDLSQWSPSAAERELISSAVDVAINVTGSRQGAFRLAEEAHNDVEAVDAADSAALGILRHDQKASSAGESDIGLSIVMDQDVEVAAIAVTGKDSDYDETDQMLLELIGDNIWRIIRRKRAEADLIENQALLEQAEQIAHLGTWDYDPASGVIRWSDETYRIHGWPHDAQVTIQSLEGLIHWDDAPRVREFARTAFDQSQEWQIEYRLVLANGLIRHVLVRGRKESGPHGPMLTGTILDNTTQHEETEKKRAFETMLLSFLDHIPAVITLKNEQLEHVYGNTAALQAFGVDAAGFTGTTDTVFLQPDISDRLHVAERSALNTRQLVRTPDFSLPDGTGERRLRGVCFPVTLPDGQVLVGMYATDITDLESATAKSLLLQTALESAANGVVITDVKGNIEWVNPAFCRITGYAPEEAIGQNSRLLKSGHHDRDFYKKMWATLLQGEVWDGEIKNRRKDGTIYREQMTITPMRGNGGSIEHFIAIKLDISERHDLEEKLLRSQRMESIGLLAGGVAHDLNNILAPILMGVELLKSPDIAEQDRDDLLETITNNCERGAGIIRQVLTFARGVEGERVIVQLRHQVKDVVKMARETFPKNIDISMDIPSNFWPVVGDPTQLHQILLNFCVNARDAMPQGGRVAFTGENVDLKENHTFQAFEIPPGKYAKLTVSDTGSGIPPEVLERVFEPFFTTKEHGKGTGLGLPTVLGIAKSHGGLVELNSTPGNGTQASVWLPASDATEEGRSKPKSTPPSGHGETILVVDDEESVRKTITTILTRYNYHVIEAVDGAEAVGLYAQHREEISLVLTDVMMPVMDGVVLAHALRRIAPDLKIVGSSGFVGEAENSDRFQQLRDAGVRTVLQKPYTPRELLETLTAELHTDA